METRASSTPLRLALLVSLLGGGVVATAACGGDESTVTPASGGSGGQPNGAGASGASGKAGAAGKASAAGSGGASGGISAGGKSGAAGQAGASAGSAGQAGAGSGGAEAGGAGAGAGGAGMGGSAGSVGATPPGVAERISTGNGYAHAITLTPGGAPTIAYGVLSGISATPYAVTIGTRGEAGWTHEPVTPLVGSVYTVDIGYDAAGERHLGYVEYPYSSGVGYDFRIWAASDATGSFTAILLGDHSVNHNTAVGPDVDVARSGEVHVIIPLTTEYGAASSVRHLGLVAGAVVDETITPLLSGSSFGPGIGRIGAAVSAEPPLSLFTVAESLAQADTRACLTTPSGKSATAVPIGTFPDLGSSLTEVWGAALHRSPTGSVALTANSTGSGPVRYQVLREGDASWALQTVGPLSYGSMGWCSTLLADKSVALFVYAGIGMPVKSTGLRLLLVAPDGTYTDRVVDADVESGIPCSAVADDAGIHVAYRKPDSGLYYQLVLP